jgi:transcriptional regulator with XRE-family HTH domain
MSTPSHVRPSQSPPMASRRGKPFPLSVWFGEAIRVLREERQETQEALGRQLGAKQRGGRVLWETIENGKGNPTLRTIGRMAEALEIDWMTLCRAVESQRVRAIAQRSEEHGSAGDHRRPRDVRAPRPKPGIRRARS